MPKRFNIKLIPRASRNEMVEMPDGTLKVRLTAPPVDGAANEALIAFLSDTWDIPKSSIRIVSGLTSRNKVIETE
jgi:uncharacterized protein (TIGR00251 family)